MQSSIIYGTSVKYLLALAKSQIFYAIESGYIRIVSPIPILWLKKLFKRIPQKTKSIFLSPYIFVFKYF